MSPEGGSARSEAPPAHRLRLVHDGAAIDVGSDDASALVWLAEFLGPAFACVLGPDAYERDLLEALRGLLASSAASTASRKPSSVYPVGRWPM